jgi:uracil phosphoribosyltransferase
MELRDARPEPPAFRRAATRISTLLAAEALRDVPSTSSTVITSHGPAEGQVVSGDVVVAPVLRAGLGMLDAVLALLPVARVGHIGLQCDKSTAIATTYYARLPPDIGNSFVMVIDPVLAAGARAICMICIVAAPKGVDVVTERHPDVALYAPVVDRGLDTRKYIVSGLGDFGDRLYGTV